MEGNDPMKYSDAKLNHAAEIIKHVAKENAVTEDEVRRDMTQLIAEGFRNPDPSIQERWKSIPHVGKIPTPEEVIIWSVEQLKNSNLQ